MARRIALATLALAALLPASWRQLGAHRARSAACAPEGRGVAPRHWIGCAADPGPARALTGRERLLSGLPVLLNEASPEDLASVPGFTARLAVEAVADRATHGPFESVEDLTRVRGIGPGRLALARPFLAVEGP
jgi:competence protein ComEA